MAEPRREASKREGIFDPPALFEDWFCAASEEDAVPAPDDDVWDVCCWREERRGFVAWRFGAWRSDARWSWKSSVSWYCSCLPRMPLSSRTFLKFASLRSAMWIRYAWTRASGGEARTWMVLSSLSIFEKVVLTRFVNPGGAGAGRSVEKPVRRA